MTRQESVPAVLESEATGEIADIYADIRATLDTSVVNLIWRNLATMPGALSWAWSAARPLYLAPAAAHAESIRRSLKLPDVPGISRNALSAAGIDRAALADIRTVLNGYYHTNALALAVLSALLEHHDPSAIEPAPPSDIVPIPSPTELPPLPPTQGLSPEVQRLIGELNEFGEDTDSFLIASMYRHLAYWPAYLAIVRTLLAPYQADGSLNALTRSARSIGRAHGKTLARQLTPCQPPDCLQAALASCRLFVEHPIARMAGICAIIRRATPE